MRGLGARATVAFLALTLFGASGASIPLTTDVTVRIGPHSCTCSLLSYDVVPDALMVAQEPITVPWDPSLRPRTNFLPLNSGLTADNTTGNEPSQVHARGLYALHAWQMRPCGGRQATALHVMPLQHDNGHTPHQQVCSEKSWDLLLRRSTCRWQDPMRWP